MHNLLFKIDLAKWCTRHFLNGIAKGCCMVCLWPVPTPSTVVNLYKTYGKCVPIVFYIHTVVYYKIISRSKQEVSKRHAGEQGVSKRV